MTSGEVVTPDPATRAVVVRYTTTTDRAEENAALVRAVYDDLASSAPTGFDYGTVRLADGVTFVHIAFFHGEDNPLASSSAFAAFQEGISQRCSSPPDASAGTVIGSYRAARD